MEIVKIHFYKNERVIIARELHEYLGSKQDFSTWIKNRIEKYRFIPNKDFIRYHKKMEANNAKLIEYAITMDMAKELCMVENNDNGRIARRYFIEKEKELHLIKQLPVRQNLSRLEILQMAIKSEESRLKLEAENSQLKPKAELADRIIETPDLIDIGQVSKVLGLPYGRNTLFKELRERGIFFKSRNEPKQNYIDTGYFKLKEKLIERENNPGFVVLKVLVTQKGLLFLSKIFQPKQILELARIEN